MTITVILVCDFVGLVLLTIFEYDDKQMGSRKQYFTVVGNYHKHRSTTLVVSTFNINVARNGLFSEFHVILMVKIMFRDF